MTKANQNIPLGFNGAWSMAVGGMIGGGIFSVLGVVVAVAGAYAWLSFLLGGMIALATGYSYAELTVRGDQAGGIYRFLEQRGRGRAAGVAAWVLIVGYTFTVSVYAFTFGSYVAGALGGPVWLPQGLAAVSVILIAGVNLAGAGEATGLEVVTVWGKLAVLGALAAWGIWQWSPDQLHLSAPAPGWAGALVGAGTVFMAYEGFQLLAYDYCELEDRKRLISRAMTWAILTAIAVYIAVSLGAVMLVGADTVVRDQEIALAEAGRAAWGTPGFIVVTVAAAFSAASAINATIFATARLARDVAEDRRLPAIFSKEDARGSPFAGTMVIAGIALILIFAGGLQILVKAASLVFLAAFAGVNFIALREGEKGWLVAASGLAGAAGAIVALVLSLAGLV